jgi:regulator of protease activity HflC (stomatin/prohibitin superfamily)
MRSVDTGKVGVVTQMGRVTGRELSEGFSFVAPWGFNNVTEYDIKTLKTEAESKAATKDLQDVSATVVLNYRLERGKVSEMHQTVGEKYQDILVAPALQEVFKSMAAKYTATESITERPALKADVVEGLTERLKKYGISVQDVSLTNFAFSEAFNNAIEATQVANQNVARMRQELESVKVQAEKDITAAQGAAEAQRLQQQTLTTEILQKQAIEKWDGKLPTTYAGDNGTLFNIPLR